MPNNINNEVPAPDNDNLETTLNNRLGKFFKRLEKKLNKNSMPYGDLQPGNLFIVPQILGFGGGVTVVPPGGEAFSLQPPVAGQIRDAMIQESNKNKFVIRRFIGYAMAARLALEEDDEKVFNKLRFIIEEMIMTAMRQAGFDHNTLHHGRFAQLERTGRPGVYLTDVEDSAAFEIRLYSDTYPAFNIQS